MPYHTSHLSLTHGQVHVHHWAGGPQLLVAWHGFGRTGADFAPLAAALQAQYTVVAPDLPFHGLTQWESAQYNLSDLTELLEALAGPATPGYHLLGQSLGGRLALSVAPVAGEKLNALFLLTPDGLGGPYAWLTNHLPGWLRSLIAEGFCRRDQLLRWAEKRHRQGRLAPFAYRYLQWHFATETRRFCLLRTWQSLPNFRPNRRLLARHAAASGLPIHVLLGSRDRVVRTPEVSRYFQHIPQAQLTVVAGGHQLPWNTVISWIKGA